MKVGILVEDQYQVLEVWYPYLRLREEGITAIFIGTGRGEYKSKEGYPVKEGLSIERVKAKDFSGVIIPGGYAPDILRRHKKVCAFVREVFIKGNLTASICHGGWVLISSGILKDKRVTGFYAIKDDLVNAGAVFLDREVVVDGNLITSRNPYDLPAFCREIIKFLNRKTK